MFLLMSIVSSSGTVFDDISMRGCIAQSECQCKHNKIYNSGEVYRQDREEWYVRNIISKIFHVDALIVLLLTEIAWLVSVHVLRVDGLVRAFLHPLHVQLKRVHT